MHIGSTSVGIGFAALRRVEIPVGIKAPRLERRHGSLCSSRSPQKKIRSQGWSYDSWPPCDQFEKWSKVGHNFGGNCLRQLEMEVWPPLWPEMRFLTTPTTSRLDDRPMTIGVWHTLWPPRPQRKHRLTSVWPFQHKNFQYFCVSLQISDINLYLFCICTSSCRSHQTMLILIQYYWSTMTAHIIYNLDHIVYITYVNCGQPRHYHLQHYTIYIPLTRWISTLNNSK